MQKNSKEKQMGKIIGGIIIFILIMYVVNVRPILANYTLGKGLQSIKQGEFYTEIYAQENNSKYKDAAQKSFDNGIFMIKKAIDYNTFQSRDFRGVLAETVFGFYTAETLPEYKAGEYLNLVIEELEKSIKNNPCDAQVYAYTMTAYNMAAIYDFNRLNRTIELGKLAVALSPNRPQIYSEIAKAKISQKKKDEAIAYFQKAVDLNPTTIESNWNLALAYTKIGEIEKAKAITKIMEDLGYDINVPSDAIKWISMYEKVDDWEKVAWLYDKLIELQPIASNYLKAAEINKKIDNKDTAKIYAARAKEINPELKQEVQLFLESL